MGCNGVYFDERFLFLDGGLSGWISSGSGEFFSSKSWSTSSVITLNPLESSRETTLGGGVSPPSREAWRSRMVFWTSARLAADKTDKEVGGLRLPIPSLDDIEDMDPPIGAGGEIILKRFFKIFPDFQDFPEFYRIFLGFQDFPGFSRFPRGFQDIFSGFSIIISFSWICPDLAYRNLQLLCKKNSKTTNISIYRFYLI
jgi:hypothetical protein